MEFREDQSLREGEIVTKLMEVMMRMRILRRGIRQSWPRDRKLLRKLKKIMKARMIIRLVTIKTKTNTEKRQTKQ